MESSGKYLISDHIQILFHNMLSCIYYITVVGPK